VLFDGGFSVSNNEFNAVTIPSPPNYVDVSLGTHVLTFVDPANPAVPATTDSFGFTNPAVTAIGTFNGLDVTVLDLNGNVLASASIPPVDPGVGRPASVTSFNVAGIHQVRFTNVPHVPFQGIAPFDDVTFGALTAVPRIVTVTAPVPTATETGLTPGSFTLTRTGSTAQALTVFFTVGGGATAGVDYVTLPGSVVIPAGQTSSSLTLTPIDDGLVEGAETVIVTLSANTAYVVGSPSAATVTITDDDTPPGRARTPARWAA
jgi:hypothetical protein